MRVNSSEILPKRPGNSGSTIDPADVARFDRLAKDWWDPWGPMRPLHKMNPVRADYVTDLLTEAFGRPADAMPGGRLAGLHLLDIGCGGGLLAEALCRRGADVTAIDPSPNNIDVARAHAAKSGLAIDYRVERAEALPADTVFDAVLAMEVIEHVSDRGLFIATLARLVRPGGLVVLSTLNRTLRSFGLAILGAEYVLRWLPRGTHDWNQFVTPQELAEELRAADLAIFDRAGLVYNPLFGEWRLSDDCAVNYFMAAEKRADR